MLPGLESAVTKAFSSAIPFAAAFARTRFEHARRAKVIRPLQESDVAAIVGANIPDEKAAALLQYVASPDFAHVALRLVVIACDPGVTTEDQEKVVVVRDELREGIKHQARLTGWQLRNVTDTLFGAMLGSAQKHVAELGTNRNLNQLQVAAAADMTAAAVRNSTLHREVKSLSALHEFSQALRAQVKAVHDGIRLHHIEFNKTIPYAQLNVEPTIAFRRGHSPTSEYLDTGKKADTPSLLDLVHQPVRVVVLGNPGAGKSTLAEKLSFDIATSDESWQVPFLLPLREYSEQFRKGEQSLSDYFHHRCNERYQMQAPPNAIEYLLLNGRAAVILDGLDELVDISLRRRVVDAVDAFAHRYPTVPIVVTSRRIGYEEVALDGRTFAVADLKDFADWQIAEYVNKWFSLGSTGTKQQTTTSIASSFMSESAVAAPDLRSNPLLLSLLCEMYAAERYIPQNLPDVFQKCAQLLFRRWDHMRGVPGKLRFSRQVESAISYLAWELFNQSSGLAAMRRGAIVDMLACHLHAKRFEDLDEARDAAESFVDYCAGRAWVLTEVGTKNNQPLYGFTHRSFMEYFAAEHMVKGTASVEDLAYFIHPKVGKSGWEAMCQLIIQVYDYHNEDGATEFLESLLGQQEKGSTYPADGILRFCCRSLNFVIPNQRTVRRITTKTLHRAIKGVVLTDRTIALPPSAVVLGDLLQFCSEENIPAVQREIELILTSSDDRSTNLFALIAPALLKNSKPLDQRRDLWAAYSDLVSLKCRPDDREYDRWRLVFECERDAERLGELLAAHGVSTLFQSFTLTTPWSVYEHVLANRMILASGSSSLWRDHLIQSEANQLKALVVGAGQALVETDRPWISPGQSRVAGGDAAFLGSAFRTRVRRQLAGKQSLLLASRLILALPLFEQVASSVGDNKVLIGDGSDLDLGGAFHFARLHADVKGSDAAAAKQLELLDMPIQYREFLQLWLRGEFNTVG